MPKRLECPICKAGHAGLKWGVVRCGHVACTGCINATIGRGEPCGLCRQLSDINHVRAAIVSDVLADTIEAEEEEVTPWDFIAPVLGENTTNTLWLTQASKYIRQVVDGEDPEVPEQLATLEGKLVRATALEASRRQQPRLDALLSIILLQQREVEALQGVFQKQSRWFGAFSEALVHIGKWADERTLEELYKLGNAKEAETRQELSLADLTTRNEHLNLKINWIRRCEDSIQGGTEAQQRLFQVHLEKRNLQRDEIDRDFDQESIRIITAPAVSYSRFLEERERFVTPPIPSKYDDRPVDELKCLVRNLQSSVDRLRERSGVAYDATAFSLGSLIRGQSRLFDQHQEIEQAIYAQKGKGKRSLHSGLRDNVHASCGAASTLGLRPQNPFRQVVEVINNGISAAQEFDRNSTARRTSACLHAQPTANTSRLTHDLCAEPSEAERNASDFRYSVGNILHRMVYAARIKFHDAFLGRRKHLPSLSNIVHLPDGQSAHIVEVGIMNQLISSD